MALLSMVIPLTTALLLLPRISRLTWRLKVKLQPTLALVPIIKMAKLNDASAPSWLCQELCYSMPRYTGQIWQIPLSGLLLFVTVFGFTITSQTSLQVYLRLIYGPALVFHFASFMIYMCGDLRHMFFRNAWPMENLLVAGNLALNDVSMLDSLPYTPKKFPMF